MKRLRVSLLFLALLLAVPLARGDAVSHPIVFSGVEEMRFENGISPTPDYDGLRFYGIDASAVTATIGDMSSAADSLVTIGDVVPNDVLQYAVWKADISALPDSCVVLDATLYMLRTATNAASTYQAELVQHRLFRPFDNQVSWTYRTAEGADTAWYTAGALGALAAGARWPAFGTSTYLVRAGDNMYVAGATELPTYAGFTIATGSDSLYGGYQQTATNKDAFPVPDMTTSAGIYFGEEICWLRLDVTEYVQRWHTNTWKNCGALLHPGYRTEVVDNVYASFHGCFPDTDAVGAPSKLKPFLVVHYLHAVWP